MVLYTLSAWLGSGSSLTPHLGTGGSIGTLRSLLGKCYGPISSRNHSYQQRLGEGIVEGQITWKKVPKI